MAESINPEMCVLIPSRTLNYTSFIGGVSCDPTENPFALGFIGVGQNQFPFRSE